MTSTELTGRELDAAVAERVMGWDVMPWDEYVRRRQRPVVDAVVGEQGVFRGANGNFRDKFSPSTDIAAAWLVVEKLKLTVGYAGNAGWYAGPGEDGDWDCWSCLAVAPTAPEAIARAALAAVESEAAQ